MASEEQALQRLYICTSCNHIHGDGNAWIIVVAELRQDRFRVFFGLISNLFAEFIACAKFLAHGLDNVIRVAVGFCKNKGFRYFISARENFWQFFLESADNRAYLIRVDNIPVKLRGGIGLVFVLHLPAFFPG